MEKDNILYIGAFLDEDSKCKLQTWFLKVASELGINDYKLYCNHMTIAFKDKLNDDIIEYTTENLGKTFGMRCVRFGVSDKAVAVQVETSVPSNNKIKHITIATLNTGKPVDSNYISEWKDMQPIMVRGKIETRNKK